MSQTALDQEIQWIDHDGDLQQKVGELVPQVVSHNQISTVPPPMQHPLSETPPFVMAPQIEELVGENGVEEPNIIQETLGGIDNQIRLERGRGGVADSSTFGTETAKRAQARGEFKEKVA